MYAEQFPEFLKSSARLYQLPYAELESLVLEFPYASNLRLLLFAKSWLERRPDAQNHLQKASLYSTDRRALYAFVQELSTQLLQTPVAQEEIVEDVLELMPLDALSTTNTPPEHAISTLLQASVPLSGSPTPPPPPKKRKSTIEVPEREVVRQKLEQLFNESFPVSEYPTIQHTAPIAPLPKDPHKKKRTGDLQRHTPQHDEQEISSGAQPTPSSISSPGAPMPKSSLSSWQQKINQTFIAQRLQDLHQAIFTQNQEENVEPSEPMPEIARKSILDNPDVASETYATLLAQQKEYKKAIEVYQRLILKFPEKTAFFAGEIELLKTFLT